MKKLISLLLCALALAAFFSESQICSSYSS